MVRIVNNFHEQSLNLRPEDYRRKLIELFHRYLDATGGQLKNEILLVINGFLDFLQSGVTPESANLARLRLYAATSGLSAEIVSEFISFLNPLKKQYDFAGILKLEDNTNIERVVEVIRTSGYYLFNEKLPDEWCQDLINFAERTPSHHDNMLGQKVGHSILHTDSELLGVVKSAYSEQDIINNQTIQRIILDPSIISIARRYLNTEPVLSGVDMWWSLKTNGIPSDDAAQTFHWDLHTGFKWVKFFFYLTDVTEDSGPHTFVKGSHIWGTKPQELLNRGYARIPDEDIYRFYPAEDVVSICAPVGTIMVGDTRCYHKGKPLSEGKRLLLQPVFTNSLFSNALDSQYTSPPRIPMEVKIDLPGDGSFDVSKLLKKYTLI